jgi:CRP/FNR family cyclic AMP-dependent transcriptional regulator
MIATTPALFQALASIHVVAGTNLAAQTLLAQEGIVHNFFPNTWIVREGEEGHSLFVIVEGDVQVVKHGDTPRSVVIATLHQGDVFGEMCVVDPVPRTASVLSLSPVKAIEIKAATLHHLYQKLPDQYAIILLNLARDMARRLRQIDEAFCARSS